MKKIRVEKFEGIYALCTDSEKKWFAIEQAELPTGTVVGDLLEITEDGNLRNLHAAAGKNK